MMDSVTSAKLPAHDAYFASTVVLRAITLYKMGIMAKSGKENRNKFEFSHGLCHMHAFL